MKHFVLYVGGDAGLTDAKTYVSNASTTIWKKKEVWSDAVLSENYFETSLYLKATMLSSRTSPESFSNKTRLSCWEVLLMFISFLYFKGTAKR